MTDQASQLRNILLTKAAQPALISLHPHSTRYVMISGGKGGVGKSVIALNLSCALKHQGYKVCLLDAQPGLGHIDILSGVNGYWNLSHVLAGSRQLEQVLLKLQNGLTILPGASELHELFSSRHSLKDPALQPEVKQVFDQLEKQFDLLIFDLGSGHLASSQKLAQLAHDVLIVTNTETTSMADTYSLLKHWKQQENTSFQLIMNQAEKQLAELAMKSLSKTLQTFLKKELSLLGVIPEDPGLKQSVAMRKPLIEQIPESTASRALRRLALDLGQSWTPAGFEKIDWRTLSKSA